MQVKKQQSEPDMEQNGSNLRKFAKAVYCYPTYLTSMQNTSCTMLGWMNHKLETAGRNNLRYTDTTIMAESKEELKSLFMKVKESEKADLKLNIQKTKIMTSSPITSWQIDGRKVGTVTNFIFLGSRITVNADCSHEIKRRLLL